MKDATLAMPLLVLTFAICWSQGNLKCVPTSDASDIKDVLISQFKKKVLKRLGYSVPPNVTDLLTDQLRQEMARKFYQDHGLAPIDTHSHVYQETEGPMRNFKEHFPNVSPVHTSTFQIKDYSPEDRPIEKAWLRFCNKLSGRVKQDKTFDQRGRLHIYRIENEAGSPGSSRHLVLSRPIRSLRSACLKVEVTDSLKKHFTGNVTFVIVFFKKGERPVPTVEGNRSSVMSHIKSTLLVNMAKRGQVVPREKRETGRSVCDSKDGETRCCRYHTYISFKEIEWDDWVVAPEGYDAYYCAGECPHRYKMAHTFAGIKSLLHLMDSSRMPSPTCTATELRPLTLLHFDDAGKMTYTDYPDMIVDRCQCS